MPEPYEEIKALNGTKENPNSTRKIIEAEVRGRWEAENPGKSFNDALFKREIQEWKADTQALLEDYGNRWNDQKLDISAFSLVDSKLSLKLEPFSNDAPAKAIYRELMDRFGDANVSHFPKAPWDLPSDAVPVWKDMLDITKQQVQRNATKLASVVTTVRTVATDEVRRGTGGSDPAVKEWEGSDLYKTLQDLEKTLMAWDDLLASSAFPDRATLTDAADRCEKSFFNFYREHVPVYAAGETVPYVKYQLLATMRSLAEKIASQFAAHSGNPSFSAMYSFLIDVPRTGTYEEGKLTAKTLTSRYSTETNPLVTGWKTELKGLEKGLHAADMQAAKDLTQSFKTFDTLNAAKKTLETSLHTWSANYQALGTGATVSADLLANLHTSAGEIAFGLRNYKEIVDHVLKNNSSTTVQACRQRYQETLDGFARRIEQDILLCQSLNLV